MQQVVVFVQRVLHRGFFARLRQSDYDCRFFAAPMNTGMFLASLVAHDPFDREEEVHRDRMIEFVSAHVHDWWKRVKRDSQTGHVTGSAWILNRQRTHALLLHHLKLNRWLQPGGHLDENDASPAAGAMREAREETGLAHLSLGSEALFDVDVHSIPARAARPGKSAAEPAHLHYDVRYLIIAAEMRVAISEESLDAKWMSLEDLAQPSHERSIARMAEKTLRLRS